MKDFGVVHSDSLSSMIVTPDNKWLYTSSIAGEFKKWSVSKQSLQKDFGKIYADKSKDWIFKIGISPDGKSVFVSSSNWTLGLMSQYDVESDKMVHDYGTVFPTQSF